MYSILSPSVLVVNQTTTKIRQLEKKGIFSRVLNNATHTSPHFSIAARAFFTSSHGRFKNFSTTLIKCNIAKRQKNYKKHTNCYTKNNFYKTKNFYPILFKTKNNQLPTCSYYSASITLVTAQRGGIVNKISILFFTFLHKKRKRIRVIKVIKRVMFVHRNLTVITPLLIQNKPRYTLKKGKDRKIHKIPQTPHNQTSQQNTKNIAVALRLKLLLLLLLYVG